jgi:transcriptional regulator with XRE-family HTH domain|nr:MAG TPA_asm: Helix-turn-helix XRE-family like protein [Caudoviricetes sp.]
MLDEKFYIQLKKFFKRQGITQAEIAERYGTTQAYINLLLNGKTPIGKSCAVKLHELYGLSVSWLLTGDGNMIDESTTNTVNINRDSVKVGGNVSGGIQQGECLAEVVEKLVNELAEQRRASNKQQELINTLISQLITDKKT